MIKLLRNPKAKRILKNLPKYKHKEQLPLNLGKIILDISLYEHILKENQKKTLYTLDFK